MTDDASKLRVHGAVMFMASALDDLDPFEASQAIIEYAALRTSLAARSMEHALQGCDALHGDLRDVVEKRWDQVQRIKALSAAIDMPVDGMTKQ